MDFIFAVAITGLLVFLKHYHGIEIKIDYSIILSVLAGLFAFVFAALAIIISLSDQRFLELLKEQDIFHRLLFHYWFACVCYLFGIFIVFSLSIFSLDGYYKYIAIFVFTYSIFLSLLLVKTTIAFGFYREEFSSVKPPSQNQQ